MLKDMNKTATKTVTDKITEEIDTTDRKFSNMFTEIKDDIKSVRAKVLDAKADVEEVKTRLDTVEESLNFQGVTLTENEEKQKASLNKVKAEIDTKIQGLNQKMLLMEKRDKKYNLLFYGFPEEGSENLFDKLKNAFVKNLDIDNYTVDNMYFTHRHRMPAENQQGPRPVILNFGPSIISWILFY